MIIISKLSPPLGAVSLLETYPPPSPPFNFPGYIKWSIHKHCIAIRCSTQLFTSRPIFSPSFSQSLYVRHRCLVSCLLGSIPLLFLFLLVRTRYRWGFLSETRARSLPSHIFSGVYFFNLIRPGVFLCLYQLSISCVMRQLDGSISSFYFYRSWPTFSLPTSLDSEEVFFLKLGNKLLF